MKMSKYKKWTYKKLKIRLMIILKLLISTIKKENSKIFKKL